MSSTLSDIINDEIKNAGGRLQLARLIVSEWPNNFPEHELQKLIYANIRNRRAKQKRALFPKQRLREKSWSEEDGEYVMRKYGTMSTRILASFLCRSKPSVQSYYFRFATPVQLLWLRTESRNAKYRSNFKR